MCVLSGKTELVKVLDINIIQQYLYRHFRDTA